MELRLEIGYNELLELIRQLPVSQLEKLKSELSEKIIEEKTKNEHSEFQKFLLNGPIMTDDQYQQFLDLRKSFNQWRVN